MNEEVPLLQQEVNRLNYIIDLLIKENQQLRAVLPETQQTTFIINPVTQHLLKENILNWLISSNAEKENTSNEFIPSNPKEEAPSNKFVSSNAEKENTLNEFVSSHLQKEGVSNNLISSKPAEGIQPNRFISSNQENGSTSNNFISSGQETENPSNKPVPLNNAQENAANQPNASISQKENTEKHIDVFKALKTMRTGKISASRQSVKNSVILLQHLVDNPKNNTKQLSKATGMSESGLSKRLSALRKQGYVTKLKVRHYVLTQKGLDVLGL